MSGRVVLIRHGRSSHLHKGWIDRNGFLRWREAYEAAGITPGESAPEELRTLVSGSECVIASDTRRGIESATALAPDREIVTSELLRELELAPPKLAGIRLPLFGWALLYGPQWLVRFALGQSQISPVERERIDAAASWIEQLTQIHGTISVITHAWFRRQLSRALQRRGWRKESYSGGARNWSAWSLSRG